MGRLFALMGMGRIKTIGTRIPVTDTRRVKCDPKRADPELLTDAHRRWRLQVCERAGWRCEAIDGGRRCDVRRPQRLFADHKVERRDGGAALDVENGECLCGSHHTRKTAAARGRRLAETFTAR